MVRRRDDQWTKTQNNGNGTVLTSSCCGGQQQGEQPTRSRRVKRDPYRCQAAGPVKTGLGASGSTPKKTQCLLIYPQEPSSNGKAR